MKEERKCSTTEDAPVRTRDRFTLLIVVLAGLGTAHILVRTATYGAAFGIDSTYYLATAINILAGEGWRDFRGAPLITWPPLFPLLLAAFGWVGIDPMAAGRFINAAAFGLTILVAGCWLRSNLRSQWLGLAATLIIAVSLPLGNWAASFMTESLFVLLTLLVLVQLASFLHRQTALSLGSAAVCTALAALLRYPGVVLIGSGVLLLGLLARRKHALIFGAVSSLPLLAVLARNWATTGNLTHATGRRTGEVESLPNALREGVKVLRDWVVPQNAPDGVAYLLGLTLAAVGLASVTVILRARRMYRAGVCPLEAGAPFGVFALIYLVFIVAIVPFDDDVIPCYSRLLLPVYVPLLLTAVMLLDRFSVHYRRRVAVALGLAALVLLATLAHVGYSARENLRLTAQVWGAGYDDDYGWFNSAYWQQSETLNYLRENPINGRIYTNYRELTWFVDRTAVPGKHRGIPLEMRWTQIEARAHIVWFNKFYDHSFLTCDYIDLRVLSGVETVAELADGFILRRTAAEPFDAAKHRARKQRYVNQLIQQADERVVRAGWHVYRTGLTLIYRKKPCVPADVQAKFVLHVVPVDRADLPADRKQYDSENLDFYFNWRGERVGDECRAIVRLPAYAIARVHIGQWISAENRTLWEAEFSPSR